MVETWCLPVYKYKTLHNCPLSLDFKQISPSVYFSSLQLLLVLGSLLSFMQELPISLIVVNIRCPTCVVSTVFCSRSSGLSGHAPLHVSRHHMNAYLYAVQPKLFNAFYGSADSICLDIKRLLIYFKDEQHSRAGFGNIIINYQKLCLTLTQVFKESGVSAVFRNSSQL